MYKVPRRVEFVAELPREATGKLYRRKLRDAFRAEGDATRGAPGA
jgi:acyl-coenzyme A synthetase/AMP-(fatty) acid ligase